MTRFLATAMLGAALAAPGFSTHADPGVPADPAGSDWPSFARSWDGQRYVPLDGITAANVGTLAKVCELEVGEQGPFRAATLVVDGRMYTATAHTVVAADATNCSVHWRHVYEYEEAANLPSTAQGVGYLDGRIFRGYSDGRLIALDARTGEQVWRVKIGDPKLGEYFVAAPIAWNGLVFIGTAGGDFGIQGRMMAFDAATGREVWRFNTVPLPGEPGFETWRIPETARRGGGGTWTSYTLDAATGELFIPVGNPSPLYAPRTRPGDNLYTNSVLVLDALTGKHRWHYQAVRNDALDYDISATPMLYTDANGRPMVVAAGKDGFLYGIERDTRKLRYKTPFTTIFNVDKRPGTRPIRTCPGTVGGAEWNGASFDPRSNTVFIGGVDWCAMVSSEKDPKYAQGTIFWGGVATPIAGEKPDGWVVAVDGTTGKPRWKFRAGAPVLASVTPTAGGLLFTGNMKGELLALDMASGEERARVDVGGSVNGGLATYAVGGRQYLAVASGGIFRGQYFNTHGAPKVVVMTTDAQGVSPRLVKLPELPNPAGFLSAHDTGAVRGQKLYMSFCASCHGPEGEGGVGARLKGVTARKDPRPVLEIIKQPGSQVMPSYYPNLMNDADAADIAAWVEGLK
ncbi:MAG: PQQ-binding-like beta-propeller repeat protein [Gammaproteobacteria bacterium]